MGGVSYERGTLVVVFQSEAHMTKIRGIRASMATSGSHPSTLNPEPSVSLSLTHAPGTGASGHSCRRRRSLALSLIHTLSRSLSLSLLYTHLSSTHIHTWPRSVAFAPRNPEPQTPSSSFTLRLKPALGPRWSPAGRAPEPEPETPSFHPAGAPRS